MSRRARRTGTRILSAAMVLIGVALIVRTFVAGGGVGARGVIVGALFVAAGLGRLWLARGDE